VSVGLPFPEEMLEISEEQDEDDYDQESVGDESVNLKFNHHNKN